MVNAFLQYDNRVYVLIYLYYEIYYYKHFSLSQMLKSVSAETQLWWDLSVSVFVSLC